MNQRTEYITDLLIRRLRDELSPGEEALLQAWRHENAAHEALYAQLNNADEMAAILLKRNQYDEERIGARLRREFTISESAPAPFATPVHRVHFLKTAWFRYVAAVLLIATAVAVYYSVFHAPRSKNEVAVTVPSSKPGDAYSNYSRAVLTLSNGQKVELDSASSKIIKDGNLSIEQNDGQLSYQNAGAALINTMATPKGSQYQLTLSDGTRVWLNAASSITYPTSFNNKTREVSVTGEAYFEVSQNKEKPFIVKTSSNDITVLGTAFNVNAYPDEQSKISLIQGTVRVADKVLKPGQAYFNYKIIPTDIEQDIAWKNGVFDFEDAGLQDVMRQLARWYDITIVYKNDTPDIKFFGKMSRGLPLTSVIKALEESKVHLKLEGKRLIVSP